MNPLFSTYSTGENRVTATIISVLERINIQIFNEIIRFIEGESTIELIKYTNQDVNNNSIPDARIMAKFDYLFETKIVPNSVDVEQINNHIQNMDEDFSKLFVLTPDENEPEQLKTTTNYDKIKWFNYNHLLEALEGVIEDSDIITYTEKYFLNELINFLYYENLILEDVSNKALIVPAKDAWDEYLNYSAYFCQANRFFQRANYLGFYKDGQIKKKIPKILGYINSLDLQNEDIQNIDDKRIILTGVNGTNHDDFKRKLLGLKENNINQLERWAGFLKFVLLTDANHTSTITLENEIINDKKSSTGKNTAFVQKQTYISTEEINNVNYTSELKVL